MAGLTRERIACAALPLLAALSMQAKDDPPTWVEMGAGGALARQVLELNSNGQAPACPKIDVRGVKNAPTAMTARYTGAASSSYPIVVCEAAIPAKATSASIGKIALPLPKAKTKAVAIVGDTGCKGNASGSGESPAPSPPEAGDEDSSEKQNCHDGWPLNQVAASAAKQPPDLVIHVGDYVYVTKDSWKEWDAQFFTPAKALLLAAPWIFVRGNHETCGRHGAGYFALLDPGGATSCTSDATAPYLVTAGGAQYVVLDSSGATCDFPDDCKGDSTVAPAQQPAVWTALLKQAQNAVPAKSTAALLTHRPVWGAKTVKETNDPTPAGFCPGDKSGKRILNTLNSVLQSAWTAAKPASFTMVISGHTHLFELLTYTGGPLPQVVVGDSGVELTHKVPKSLGACKLAVNPQFTASLALSTLNGLDKWGFGVLKGGNDLHIYQPDGAEALHCRIAASKAVCK